MEAPGDRQSLKKPLILGSVLGRVARPNITDLFAQLSELQLGFAIGEDGHARLQDNVVCLSSP